MDIYKLDGLTDGISFENMNVLLESIHAAVRRGLAGDITSAEDFRYSFYNGYNAMRIDRAKQRLESGPVWKMRVFTYIPVGGSFQQELGDYFVTQNLVLYPTTPITLFTDMEDYCTTGEGNDIEVQMCITSVSPGDTDAVTHPVDNKGTWYYTATMQGLISECHQFQLFLYDFVDCNYGYVVQILTPDERTVIGTCCMNGAFINLFDTDPKNITLSDEFYQVLHIGLSPEMMREWYDLHPIVLEWNDGWDYDRLSKLSIEYKQKQPAVLQQDEVVRNLPESLMPAANTSAERVRLVIEDGHNKIHIPDRAYERGWEPDAVAFYFPVASELNRVTLQLLLRVICNRERDLDSLLTQYKFRSGCLLTQDNGFTPAQLKEFRVAARVLLYGFGNKGTSVPNPLDYIGGAIAMYVNYSWVVKDVCRAFDYAYDEATPEGLLTGFNFCWLPACKVEGNKRLIRLIWGSKFFGLEPR